MEFFSFFPISSLFYFFYVFRSAFQVIQNSSHENKTKFRVLLAEYAIQTWNVRNFFFLTNQIKRGWDTTKYKKYLYLYAKWGLCRWIALHAIGWVIFSSVWCDSCLSKEIYAISYIYLYIYSIDEMNHD